MGNQVPRHGEYVLDTDERKVIRNSWSSIKKEKGNLFVLSWLTAFDGSPVVRIAFGIKPEERPLDNASLLRAAKDMETFIDSLIVGFDLKLIPCKNACEALGARHVSYSDHGFRPLYMDIFAACFLHTLEEEIDATGEELLIIVRAWRKFVHEIVDFMRTGYHRQMMLRYPP